MKNELKKQIVVKTTDEKSSVEKETLFDKHIPGDNKPGIIEKIIENGLKQDRKGGSYRLDLDPSKPLTDEQIEAFKYVFTTKTFEVKIVSDSAPNKITDKTLDTLLFIAALICPAAQRNELVGHLTERYNRDVEQWGEQQAKILLAKDIVSSWLPNIPESVRSKIVMLLVKIGYEFIINQFFG